MEDAQPDIKPVVAALQSSGFPLQARVEHEIQAHGQIGWRVLASEHPWRDPDGRDQFVDLIAYCGTKFCVIECKKSVGDIKRRFSRSV